MESLSDYVECEMNLKVAQDCFISDLCDILGLDETHIKNIELISKIQSTVMRQIVVVELFGVNRFKADDISKIKGLSIVTPNRLEIEAGEFPI